MTGQDVAVGVLLALAALVLALCSLGILVAPTVYDRIHLLGPASMVATPLVAAAVVTREALSPLGLKAMLVTLVVWISGPVLAHATARAAVIRERGGWTGDEAGEEGAG